MASSTSSSTRCPTLAPLLAAVRRAAPVLCTDEAAPVAAETTTASSDEAAVAHSNATATVAPSVTLTPEAKAELVPLVSSVNAAYAAFFAADLNQRMSTSEKCTLLRFGCTTLLDGCWTTSEVPLWLALLKILARTQKDLDLTLFAPNFVRFLIDTIGRHAAASSNTSANKEIAILSQSLRLLLNLIVVNVEQVYLALGCEPSPKRAGGLAGLFGGTSTSAPAKSDEPLRPYPVLTPFVQALPHITNSAQEPEAVWLYFVILLRLTLRVPLAQFAIAEGNLYEHLLRAFLLYTSSAALGVTLRDSASSEVSSGLSSVDTPMSCMKVCLELIRILATCSVQSDDLPTCQAQLTKENKTELYQQYINRLAALLAVGAEVPPECLEGYKGDPAANAAIGSLMTPATLPASAAASATNASTNASVDNATVSLEHVSLEDASNQTQSAPASQVQSGGSGGASSATSSEAFVPVQRQQTKILLDAMTAESSDPVASQLVEVRRQLCDLMAGADGLHTVSALEADGCRAFHGLMQLLHRSLILATHNKKESEELLMPVVTAVRQVTTASPTLRAHAKRCIFLDLAQPPAVGPDGKPFRKADANNYSMTPAGAVSEKISDPDPLSLKSLLLQWVISLNYEVKANISEMLFAICGEQSEYLRLLGFGNAVGLLAEKGLPNFTMLKQKAINIDEVAKSGKKL